MIISVDIDELQEISRMLQAAKDKIDESASTVSRIVEHNDWHCRERTAINQQISSIKTQQKRMQEKFSTFAEKIQMSANQFSEIDAVTLTAFRDLDAVFSKLLSVSTPVATVAHPPQFEDAVSVVSRTNINDSLSSYALGGFQEPIRVCNFDRILFDNR